ncbi:hypothetical protein EMIT048CA2_200038 [Pseudomonas chlororaphis]
MQGSGHRQAEGGDDGVEVFAVFGEHLIAALHIADACGHDRTTAVGVAFSCGDQRLLADDAGTADFFDVPVAIGDHPVPGEQFGGQQAIVLYGDGVGEGKAVLLGLRLFCEKAGDDADVDLIARIGHARGLKTKRDAG